MANLRQGGRRAASCGGCSRFGRVAAVGLTLAALLVSLLRGGAPWHPALAPFPPIGAFGILMGLLLVLGPWGRPICALTGRLLFESSQRVFGVSLFLVTAAASAGVSLLVFDGIPYIDDGVAALFQARIFSCGAVVWPLPPQAEFFEVFGVLGAESGVGHWAGMYPPGWPALLTPGVWLRIPWLVNPMLNGVLAVATAALGRELHGDRAGRVAGILAAVSPFLLVLAGTHLSHTATALSLCVCLWSVLRLLRTGAGLYGLLAGLAWGIAFLCRPLDAVLLGGLFAGGLLWHWRGAGDLRRGLLFGLVPAAAAVLLLLVFQALTTGHAFTAGHEIRMAEHGRFGFIALQAGKDHTPAKAMDFTLWRLRTLNDALLGWPLPFFLVALIPFWVRDRRAWDALLLASPLLLAAVFAFYWYYEAFFPARYLSASFPLLLVLAGRGLVLLHDRTARLPGRHARRLVPAAVAASLCFMVLAAFPAEVRRLWRNVGDVERILPGVVDAYGITNAVVFMDAISPGRVDVERNNDFYATGFLRNDLELKGDVVFARNSRSLNPLLAGRYPGRSCYLYRYHRDTRRALLYRLLFDGQDQCAVPVEPTESALLARAPRTEHAVGCTVDGPGEGKGAAGPR